MKRLLTPALSVLVSAACPIGFAYADVTTQVIQTINDTSYYLVESPVADAHTVAWRERDQSTNNSLIYYWDGENTQVISSALENAGAFSLQGGQIAYVSYSYNGTWENTYSLQYWDGSYANGQPNIVEIASNGVGDVSLSNGRIAWTQFDGNDSEIYLWDGSYISGQPNITQITDNDSNEMRLSFDGDVIAWSVLNYPSGDNELHYWDGTATHQLDTTTAPLGNGKISVSNGGIAWLDVSTHNIYYWDGTFTASDPNIVAAVAGGNSWLGSPSLHDGTIAYRKKDSGRYPDDSAIFYWDGTDSTQLSEWYSINSDYVPSLSADSVVYVGRNALNDLHEIRLVTSAGLCL